MKGENDSNSLRSEIARQVQAECDGAWVLAKVDRCVTNDAALSRVTELHRNGIEDIVFVCTRSDVIQG